MLPRVLLLIASVAFSQAAPIGDASVQAKRSPDLVDYGCGFSSGKRSADIVGYGCGSSYGKRSATVEDGGGEANKRSALVRGGYGDSRSSNGKRVEFRLEEPISERGYVDPENRIGARSPQGAMDTSCGYKRSPQGVIYTDCGYKRSAVDEEPELSAHQGSESELLVARDSYGLESSVEEGGDIFRR
ncbi:hypothetical protein CC79DRAFT_1320051 [Sarocladium strictum]